MPVVASDMSGRYVRPRDGAMAEPVTPVTAVRSLSGRAIASDRCDRDSLPCHRKMTSVPDKPSIDGLEAKWRETWAADGTFRFDRTKTRDEIYSIDTPPPTVSRQAAHRALLLVHPHRSRRAVPAHAGRRGLLPDGLGRQRAQHRAPGAAHARHRLRSVASLRPRLRRAGQAAEASRSASADRTSSSSATRITAQLEEAYFDLWSTLGLSVDWTPDVHDDRRSRAAHVAVRVPAAARAGPRLPGRVTDAVGRRHAHRGRAGRARRS